MNAKTEKRLGLTAAFLLTAAIFVAPNTIQQNNILHHLASQLHQPSQQTQAVQLLLTQDLTVTTDTLPSTRSLATSRLF